MKFFVVVNKNKPNWLVIYECTPSTFKLVYSSKKDLLKLFDKCSVPFYCIPYPFTNRIIELWISYQINRDNKFKGYEAEWFRSMNEIVAKYFVYFL